MSLAAQFSVGERTVGEIVEDVCVAIVKELGYAIKTPDGEEEWQVVSDYFYERWDYPNCIGALDGCHILIEPPPELLMLRFINVC